MKERHSSLNLTEISVSLEKRKFLFNNEHILTHLLEDVFLKEEDYGK